MKKIILIVMVGLLAIPAAASGYPAASAYRFGVGGYTNMISRGMEFTFWANLGQKCQWFIAPHGWGIYYFDGDDLDEAGDGFYSVGLRTGIMWATERWISPLVGIGGGYSYDASSYSYYYDYEDDLYTTDEDIDYCYGGRFYAGLSIAPFDFLSQEVEWLFWTRALRGVRFTFESGVNYTHSYHYYSYTYVDEGQLQVETSTTEYDEIFLPDFGFGISFNW